MLFRDDAQRSPINLARAAAKPLPTEIRKHRKIDAGKLIDEIAPFAGGFRFGEILSQIEDAANESFVASANGTDCNRNGNAGFADAGRTNKPYLGEIFRIISKWKRRCCLC
jgi:hypothetical protein